MIFSPIHRSFLSPWSEHPTLPAAAGAPLPQCYQVPAVPDLASKVVHWSEGTLFYVFYGMPGDQVQLIAAQELYVLDFFIVLHVF